MAKQYLKSKLAKKLPAITIIALASNLVACANSEYAEEEFRQPNYIVKTNYYSVRNDINKTNRSRPLYTTELSQNVTNTGRNTILLGHEIGVICNEPLDCRHASNLATLSYNVEKVNGTLIIKGQFNNEAGASTTFESNAGWLKRDIIKGAPLYTEGTIIQEFELPVAPGNSVTLKGPLEDKLEIVIESKAMN